MPYKNMKEIVSFLGVKLFKDLDTGIWYIKARSSKRKRLKRKN